VEETLNASLIGPSTSTFSSSPSRAPYPLVLGSGNGRRRADPPREEGRGVSASVQMYGAQRREFDAALRDAVAFEELPGKWQAAILRAERNRPSLRLIRRS
jgi:hypothetical protein